MEVGETLGTVQLCDVSFVPSIPVERVERGIICKSARSQ